MDKFKIFETDQFLQDLSQDFRGQGERIAKKLREYVYPQLRENPHSGKNIKKLKNYRPETCATGSGIIASSMKSTQKRALFTCWQSIPAKTAIDEHSALLRQLLVGVDTAHAMN